jgi:2-oxo-3-hexenedioate decarboxylase/2-keto-4-pentenoate hydratase
MTDIAAAADLIAAARRTRTPLGPLPPAAAPQDEAQGYRVQDRVHALLADDFGAQVGHKIGCTSAVMQAYLNIPHPCSGGIFADGVHDSSASLSCSDYVRVGVECEIGVRLNRDLIATDEPFTADNIVHAIDAYLPAIEIVDDRYADWRTLGVPTLTADDFFAAGCVLGEPLPSGIGLDLLAVTGHAIINGREVGRGTGADVLGHPHHALAWLANHLAGQGKILRAGEIVLTGSLTQVVWLQPGDTEVLMELSGLGSVEVEFN